MDAIDPASCPADTRESSVRADAVESIFGYTECTRRILLSDNTQLSLCLIIEIDINEVVQGSDNPRTSSRQSSARTSQQRQGSLDQHGKKVGKIRS